MNRSLIFIRAWHEHKTKIAHNCKSDFSKCLSNQYKVQKLYTNNL